MSQQKNFQILININVCLANGFSIWDVTDVAITNVLPMTHGSERVDGVKEQKESLSAWNAMRIKIPRRSSREKLCLNPRKGWGH